MPVMAVTKKTAVSSEVIEEEFEEFEEQYEEEFEEQYEEEFEEQYEEEAPVDEEYEDVEEEAYEEEGAKEEKGVEAEKEAKKEEPKEVENEVEKEVGDVEDDDVKEFEEEEEEMDEEEEMVEEEEEEEVVAEEKEEVVEEEMMEEKVHEEEDAVEVEKDVEQVAEIGEEAKELEEASEKEEDKEMVDVYEVKNEEESIQESHLEEDKLAMDEQTLASEGIGFPSVMEFPTFLQSVSDLEKFHVALSKFLFQWKSLNRSFDSINAAMGALPPQAVPSMKQEKDERSELQIICDTMDGEALLRYIENNIEDVTRLRSEVPEALRSLPYPGELVIKSRGRFDKPGNGGFSSTTFLTSRQASILLLEFFILSGRTNEDASLKRKTDAAACSWMQRLIHKGVKSASRIDSLGLILFVACFGIPEQFCLKDLGHLLRKSNLKMNGDLFRRSSILMEKIPGIIKTSIREEMYVEAADISCAFELNETFPPLPLLSSFVTKVVEAGNKEAKECNNCPKTLRKSCMKQLFALKSALKCLQDYNLNATELCSVSIYGKISKLENRIAKDNQRLVRKRTEKFKNCNKSETQFKKLNHIGNDKQILKRKRAEKLKNYGKSETQSKKPVLSSSEILEHEEEQGFQAQSHRPDSKPDNSNIITTFTNNIDHPYGWDRTYYEHSAGYRSLSMEYHPVAQHFYHPQAPPAYGNEGRSSGRNLYQFAETVIQLESQHGIPNRSINPSSAAARFHHH